MTTVNKILDVFQSFRMPALPIDQYQQVGKTILAEKMSPFVSAQRPIDFVMLGYPMKSPNDLAAWFTKMNEIELADRDRYDINSEIVGCDKHPNGSIKKCTLKYTFKLRP